MQEIIQGPGSPSSTRKEGRRVRGAGARRRQLTWLWAGRCGRPAEGQGHSARPHCSHSRRAPGPGRGRGGQLDRAPIAWSPHLCGVPSLTPTAHQLLSLRHSTRASAFLPFSQRAHWRFSRFGIDTPSIKHDSKLSSSWVPFSSSLRGRTGTTKSPVTHQSSSREHLLIIYCVEGKVFGTGAIG